MGISNIDMTSAERSLDIVERVVSTSAELLIVGIKAESMH